MDLNPDDFSEQDQGQNNLPNYLPEPLPPVTERLRWGWPIKLAVVLFFVGLVIFRVWSTVHSLLKK